MTPLCVDLDGTLCKSNLLWESFLSLARRNPWMLLLTPFWLTKGRAHVKRQLARHADVDTSLLPYRQDLLHYLKKEKASGRTLYLATASDASLAEKVAGHLGLFSGVLASNGSVNLKGRVKARALADKFGEGGYAYVGDSASDLPVWNSARQAILVNVPPSLLQRAINELPVSEEFRTVRNPLWRPLLRALRPYQWAKNLLLFVPLVTAHLFTDTASFRHSLQAFIAFGLAASSVYLVNDLLDLEADRKHPSKALRPFASGDLPLLWGILLAPVLAVVALALAHAIGLPFLLALIAYLALTLAYSYLLKQLLVLDVITLAALYTIRIVAGAAALQIELSHWLLVFSVFFFMSLAMVKRHVELSEMRKNRLEKASRRGYEAGDLEIMASLGSSSGYLSVLTLALYIHTEAAKTLYGHPDFLWALMLILLYWISRIWLLAHRNAIQEDPVIFALKDKMTHLLLVLSMGVILAAI